MLLYLRRVYDAQRTGVLDLGWMGLSNLYINYNSLSHLTALYLSGNEFDDLPAQIPHLTCLEQITFDDNKLVVLPPGLGVITSLRNISFRGNPVESPPAEIIDRGTEAILRYLRRVWNANDSQVLDLSQQGIHTLHVSICMLTAIRTLSIDDNYCQTLPPEIGELRSLEVLTIRRNKLTSLPGTMGNLNIRELVLDGNPTLRHLPPEMALMTSLTALGYAGCELESPGMEIVGKGVHAVMTYLRACYDSITSKKLLLSASGMSQFAMEYAARQTCMHLDISNNFLATLQDGIFSFLNLTHVDVSFNRLEKIPILVGNLREMLHFAADGNMIQQLPTSLAYMDKLQYISAADNAIVDIPPEYAMLSALRSLNLAGNKIREPAGELHHVTTLTYMCLARNRITSLPFEWGYLTNVTELDLTGNHLADPPMEVRRIGVAHMLRYLRQVMSCFLNNSLDFAGLNLTEAPLVFTRNPSLIEMYLDNNRIKVLPPEIGRLPRMKILSLTFNKLTALPVELGNCTSLTRLHLEGNALHSPPEDVLSAGVDGILHYLRCFEEAQISGTLDLSDALHTDVPNEVLQVTGLKLLSLRNNTVAECTPGIIVLAEDLTHLDLSGNRLRQVPAELGSLTNLTFLALDRNPLPRLPRSLRLLTKLTTLRIECTEMLSPPPELQAQQEPRWVLRFLEQLYQGDATGHMDLDDCRLQEIPEEVMQMRHLNFLSLRRNHISSIPIGMGDLTELTHFLMDDNDVTYISPVIWQLTRLGILSLTQNPMRKLPPELGLFRPETFKTLALDGCVHLLSPPPELVVQGVSVILPYLRRLWDARQSLQLHLVDWGLSTLQPERTLDNVEVLTDLDLSTNSLTRLDDKLCVLMAALRLLVVNFNLLTVLPDNIHQLRSLETLEVQTTPPRTPPPARPQTCKPLSTHLGKKLMSERNSQVRANRLQELPANVCNLPALRHLRVRENKLQQIPEAIGSIATLEEMEVSINRISVIPTSVTALAKLQLLDAHDNRLKEFPDNARAMSSLTVLCLSDNRIRHLREELGLCPALRSLEAPHNPLLDPPEEVAVVSGPKTREYIHNVGHAKE